MAPNPTARVNWWARSTLKWMYFRTELICWQKNQVECSTSECYSHLSNNICLANHICTVWNAKGKFVLSLNTHQLLEAEKYTKCSISFLFCTDFHLHQISKLTLCDSKSCLFIDDWRFSPILTAPVQSTNRLKLTCELLPQKRTKKCPSLQDRGIKNNAAQTLAESFKITNEVKRADEFLRKRIKEGDLQAIFLLGQLYFEEGCYETAFAEFNKIKDTDIQALYQLSVMYYDGLGVKANPALGVEYMNRIINSDDTRARRLKFAAFYNLGRASFEGFGLQQSDKEAERLWLIAADDGNPKASVKAQTILGLFYCRPESQDLQKAFFWHSEACGNGSLESQGVLGLLYLTGHGIRKDKYSAWVCLKEASSRGNVYAQGHLVADFYSRKLYHSTVELAQRIIQSLFVGISS
ncbi:LRP2-binding protein-like [Scyliorhinus torazame]|uniref:LRP2-binding protein-like n=2 Tax=Scyliorhinus torazame TaxID=75743 RepID=UPI003B59771F